MNKISVIVPVYKVEPYLRKCIDSIINQDYKNLEIILVDDGSPDSCPAICDEYALKDNRIKVIHKENGGLSDARNAGLDIASGDYIFFVDSDDWIEKETLKECFDLIIKESSDAVITMYYNNAGISETAEAKKSIQEGYETIKPSAALAITMFEKLRLAAWGNLYRTGLFKEMRFKKGYIYEDLELLPRMLLQAEKITLFYRGFYNYMIREGSIMRGDIRVSEQMVEIASSNISYFEKNINDKNDMQKMILGVLFLIMNWYEQAVIFQKTSAVNRKFRKKSRALLRSRFFMVISSRYAGLKRKIHYFIILFFPKK